VTFASRRAMETAHGSAPSLVNGLPNSSLQYVNPDSRGVGFEHALQNAITIKA
jgi:hypothetical protein